MKARELTFIDIARMRSFGPVRLGSTLSEIGNLQSRPDYWQFAEGAGLSCYIGLGVVEVHFEARRSTPRVIYAEIQLYKLNGMRGRFLKPMKGPGTEILNNFRSKRISPAMLKTELRKAKVSFTEQAEETVTDDTSAVVNVGPVRFYFANHDDPVLELISLSK